MKRAFLIIALLTIFIGGTAVEAKGQKSKSFFYDGIELHGVKGWTIMPAKEGNRTTIQAFRLPSNMVINKMPCTVDEGMSQSRALEIYLEKSIEQIMENSLSSTGKTPKVKNVSPIMDGYLNNIPAKYVDLTYTKKIVLRIYAIFLHNNLITFTCTGVGSSADKMVDSVFGKILSTFAYNPESSTHRLF